MAKLPDWLKTTLEKVHPDRVVYKLETDTSKMTEEDYKRLLDILKDHPLA